MYSSGAHKFYTSCVGKLISGKRGGLSVF